VNRKAWMIGAACAALLPLAAMAQPGEGQGGHFRDAAHSPAAELLQGVTLSDAQQAQIAQIRQTAWAAAKPMMQQMRATGSQIRDLMFAAGAVDTAKLTALRQQQSQLRQQLDDQRMNVELQIRATLTSTQLAQAASTHAQVEALHQQMHSLVHAGAASTTAQ
jgi:Spy/CpxP family protein refolding chaperone